MPKSDFIFGTFDSSEYDWCSKTQPIYFPTPERDIDVIEVPGRSGDLIIDHGSYKNVETSMEVVIDGDYIERYDKVRHEFLAQPGYQTLVDSLYPDETRKARVVSIEAGTPTPEGGTMVIDLSVKPQRYLASGDTSALTVETTGAIDSSRFFEGVPKQAFGGYNALMNMPAEYRSKQFTAVHIKEYWDEQEFYNPSLRIRAWYPSGTSKVLTGWSDSDPRYGKWQLLPPQDTSIVSYWTETCSGREYVSFGSVPDDIISHYPSIACAEWLIFETPLRWEVWFEDDRIAAYYPDSGTLTPPANVMAFAPLIKIGVSGAVSNQRAILIDESVIGLNTPASITTSSGEVSLSTIYIDCESYNVYTLINDVAYNLNRYVTLDGDYVFDGTQPVSVYTNSCVDSVEIIPRWWRL